MHAKKNSKKKNGEIFSLISVKMLRRSAIVPGLLLSFQWKSTKMQPLYTSPHQKKQIMEVLEMRYIPVFERAVESVYHKKYKVVVKNKTESEIQQQLNMGTTQIPSGNNPASAHTSGKPPISMPKPKAPSLQEENELKEEYFFKSTV